MHHSASTNKVTAKDGRDQRSAPYLRLVKPERKLPRVLSARDPDLIRKIYPYLTKISDHYFRAEVSGMENMTHEAALVVSTHNGSINFPDLYCTMAAFWRRFGIETPAYGLMHKLAFKIPVLGNLLTKMGALPASRKNAEMVLDEGFPLLVCPGGDEDALKPYADRHRINFGKRRGFIRLAIRKQVPIVPVISVGAHETIFILNNGCKTARLFRIDKLLRVKSVPIAMSFPFGITIAGLMSIPLPSKIQIQVLPPIHLNVDAEKENDEEVVEKCFRTVCSTMQDALDLLAEKRRWPLLG